MSKLQIIIQARMTSTRLPGKVMLPIGECSVLEIMLARLGDLAEHTIIATTNDGTEAPIIELCQKLNIRYFQGDTEDVLGRYYFAAKHFGANANDKIIRLTSDCPLIDKELVQQVITTYQENHYDMVSLGPHSGFPRGLDTCLFSFKLLERTHQQATKPNDREHVTLGMSKFSHITCHNISALSDYSHYRLTLDEPSDYKAILEIYKMMNMCVDFDYCSLITLLKTHPYLVEINKDVEQKSV